MTGPHPVPATGCSCPDLFGELYRWGAEGFSWVLPRELSVRASNRPPVLRGERNPAIPQSAPILDRKNLPAGRVLSTASPRICSGAAPSLSSRFPDRITTKGAEVGAGFFSCSGRSLHSGVFDFDLLNAGFGQGLPRHPDVQHTVFEGRLDFNPAPHHPAGRGPGEMPRRSTRRGSS